MVAILFSCERNGIIKEYDEDGNLESECEYKDNVKDGQCKEYLGPYTTVIQYSMGKVISPVIVRRQETKNHEEIEYYDYKKGIPKIRKLMFNDIELIKVVYNHRLINDTIQKLEKEYNSKYGTSEDGSSWSFSDFRNFVDSIVIDSSFIENLFDDYNTTFVNRFEDRYPLKKPEGFPIDLRSKLPENFGLSFDLSSKEVSRNDSTIKYSVIAKSNNTTRIYPISFFKKNSKLYGDRYFVLDGYCKTYNENGKVINKIKYTNGHPSNQNAIYALYGF